MPGQFDTTTKFLVETYPADWVSFLRGGRPGTIDVVDANLSVVSAEVDNVLRVGGRAPWLAHLEFQSSYDATMGRRLVRYSAMLNLQHDLPVASVLVLLRPEADGPAITGQHQLALPGEAPYLQFSYAVRRIWQEPAEGLVNGAIGTLPLAPLGDVRDSAMPGVLRLVDERLAREAPGAEANRLRMVTYILLGLRYPPSVVDQLMPGLEHMRDSSTYQAILDQGRVEEAFELLLDIGADRLGTPDARIRATLSAIRDHARLHALVRRVLMVSSWDELLAGQE